MYIPKAIQAVLLLAVSVPVQAWNRLDKNNTVSHPLPLPLLPIKQHTFTNPSNNPL